MPPSKTKPNTNVSLNIRAKILSDYNLKADIFFARYSTPDYYEWVDLTPPKTEEEKNMELADFVNALMHGEGYSIEQVVVKYKTRISNSFGLERFYRYLFYAKLTRFINIGKDYVKADALITVIKKYDESSVYDSYDYIIGGLYEQFTDTYKVYMLTYMYNQKFLTKKEYMDKMVALCGTPILNSKLIGRTYIAGLIGRTYIAGKGYIVDYVYTNFYNNFTGVDNYEKWVGHNLTEKPIQRPSKIYHSFTVTLNSKEKIDHLVEVINSGINYNVRFAKKFVSRDNIELLIDALTHKCKKSKINTSLKQKIGNSIDQFDEIELLNLDEFVLKLRNINKTFANNIARRHKDACVGYNAYKSL